MHQGKRYNNLKKNNAIAIFIAVLILSGIIFGIAQSKSKYVIKSKDVNEITTTNFYFNSNTLSVNEKENEYYDWNGNDKYNINFKISNYEDAIRTCEFDTTYEIKAEIISPQPSDGITISYYINGENKNSSILVGNVKTDDNVNLVINTAKKINTNNLIVKIYAISKSPYEKVLTGIYDIKINSSQNYEVNLESQNNYEKLLIRTYTFSGEITINYDIAKLMLYKGTELLENSSISDGIVTLKLNSNSNYQIEFVKINDDTVTLDKDIVVKMNSV